MAEDCNLQKGRQTPKPGSITVYHGSNPPQCNKGRSLTAVPAGWPLLVWLQLNFLLDPFNWRQWWNAHCTVDSEISQAHRSWGQLLQPRGPSPTVRLLSNRMPNRKSPWELRGEKMKVHTKWWGAPLPQHKSPHSDLISAFSILTEETLERDIPVR